MTIRPMNGHEELAVSALLCECYRWLAPVEGYTREQVAFLLEERGSLRTVQTESRNQLYLVACENDTIVGMVAVDGNVIAKLYVAPGNHGRGIGGALFAAAETCVMNAGFDRMTLGTTPNTVAFYEGRGMSVAGQKHHASGVFLGRYTVLMEKVLPAQTQP
jgi:ribosomal protein S18 acetylase RimI-like enzyme